MLLFSGMASGILKNLIGLLRSEQAKRSESSSGLNSQLRERVKGLKIGWFQEYPGKPRRFTIAFPTKGKTRTSPCSCLSNSH
jgi:hypothetical protein